MAAITQLTTSTWDLDPGWGRGVVNGTDPAQTHDIININNKRLIITPAVCGAPTVAGGVVLRE